MNSMKRISIIAIVVTLWVAFVGGISQAYGQQLTVATGGEKGTYYRMFGELSQICGDSMVLVNKKTSGAVENLELLTSKKVNAAFMQPDILHLAKGYQDLSDIKTLFALYPEEVHFVASAVPFKEGGRFGFGGNTITLSYITDLAGRSVGAAGGAIPTAKVIKLMSQVPYNLVEFPDNDSLSAALKKGEIQAAVFVGGQPLGSVEAFGQGYKVLAFPENIIHALREVYMPARVSYSKLTNSTGIATVSMESLVVTRNYTLARHVEGLARLRQCFYKNLVELKEGNGTHAKWAEVKPDSKGKWQWYDLPTVSASTTQEAAPLQTRSKR